MNISEVMTRNVKSCSQDDNLGYAARLMWENDCGCVPVVDTDGRVTAMLTDRDICMAAYTQNRPLSEMPVSSASSRGVFFARSSDSVDTAERLMQQKQVRRIPILDNDRRLIGILSLNDLARAQHAFGHKAHNGLSTDSIADTIAAIGEPRAQPTMTA